MNIGQNINMRRNINGFIQDIKRDAKTRIFWNDPIQHLIYRWAWNMRPDTLKAGSYPLDVDVELANGCNFRCVMCQQSTSWLKKEDEHFMSWATLVKVVEQCKSMGVHSMKVNWRGESTLDPEAGEKIIYIKSMGIHEVQMNTNASKLTPELSDKLIRGLDRIIFSCDGLSKETYNTIRRGGNFDTFEANVRMFRQRRDVKDALLPILNKRRGLPVIRINMAVMEQNKHEVEQFKSYWKGIADEICFNSVYQPQGDKGVNKGQKRQEKRKGCPQIWQRLIIDTEGNVVPCCVDYLEKLKLGNVHEVGLKYIWQEVVDVIRDAHINHKARELEGCRKCDNFALSELNDKGEVIWTNSGNESKLTGC